MTNPSDPLAKRLRAFFALALCGESVAQLWRLGDLVVNKISARRVVRRIPENSLHLTLKFSGDIAEADSRAFANLLQSVQPTLPLAAKPGPMFSFRSNQDARVIGLQLLDSSGEISRVAQILEEGASRLGAAPVLREFFPHITIARLQVPMDLRELLAPISDQGSPLHFDAIRLYRSELSPRGSRYHVIAEERAS